MIRYILTTWVLIATAFPSAAGDEHVLQKGVVSSGGGESTNNDIIIRATVGQKEASQASKNGLYQLNGGIWTHASANDIIFKNGFEN